MITLNGGLFAYLKLKGSKKYSFVYFDHIPNYIIDIQIIEYHAKNIVSFISFNWVAL